MTTNPVTTVADLHQLIDRMSESLQKQIEAGDRVTVEFRAGLHMGPGAPGSDMEGQVQKDTNGTETYLLTVNGGARDTDMKLRTPDPVGDVIEALRGLYHMLLHSARSGDPVTIDPAQLEFASEALRPYPEELVRR